MAHEEWRDVVGYEGYYQVSSVGRVRSVDRDVMSRNGVLKHIRGRRMKIAYNKSTGYEEVALTRQNKRKLITVHRLVAKAFVPNPNGYGYVDHINGVKTDNRVENLRWCTNQQNAIYAKDHTDIGSWKRKKVLRSDGKVFESLTAAAKELGCTKSQIWSVLQVGRKTCRGYTFSYFDMEASA